jgi:hypothetical protein
VKAYGLNVESQKIADGLYEIICDKGEEAIVAFGMIPKWIMDMAERMVVEKIAPMVPPEHRDAARRQIIKEISIGIYTAAAKGDKMLV